MSIENFDIRSHIIDAIVEVFDTMVSMEVEFFDSEPPDPAGTGRMVATVNFAGNVLGIINIQVTSDLSRLMMARLLSPGRRLQRGARKRPMAACKSRFRIQAWESLRNSAN